jgi:hypothetical protein
MAGARRTRPEMREGEGRHPRRANGESHCARLIAATMLLACSKTLERPTGPLVASSQSDAQDEAAALPYMDKTGPTDSATSVAPLLETGSASRPTKATTRGYLPPGKRPRRSKTSHWTAPDDVDLPAPVWSDIQDCYGATGNERGAPDHGAHDGCRTLQLLACGRDHVVSLAEMRAYCTNFYLECALDDGSADKLARFISCR